MNPSVDDLHFEELLRAAMSARPQPPAVAHLAARAIGRARHRTEERLARLARMRRRSLWTGVVAVILIVLIAAVGTERVARRGLLSDSTVTSVSSTSSSETVSSGLSVGTETAAAAGVILIAMILLSMGMTSSRSGYGPAVEAVSW